MGGNHGTGWGRPLRAEPDHAAIPSAKQLGADASPPQTTKTKSHHQSTEHSLPAPGDERSTEAVGARLALAKREGRWVRSMATPEFSRRLPLPPLTPPPTLAHFCPATSRVSQIDTRRG